MVLAQRLLEDVSLRVSLSRLMSASSEPYRRRANWLSAVQFINLGWAPG